jgi:Mg-chelatase subunit ChlD
MLSHRPALEASCSDAVHALRAHRAHRASTASVAVGFLVASLLAVACGSSSDESQYGNDPNNRGGTYNSGYNGGSINPGSGAGAGEFAQCASNVADGEAKPVHMILAIDTSGSMCEITTDDGNKNCDDPRTKWSQIKSALTSFFADPSSKDLHVSLIPWSGGKCSGFDKPITSEVALPDTQGSLSRAVSSLVPQGGTPTHGAIDGAVRYAAQLRPTLTDNGKVIIALATDGLPTGCSDIGQAEASAAASNAGGTPLYVIGVGEAGKGNMKNLAVAGGGTSDAYNVSSANATSEFARALADIKGNALGCNLQLPLAPAGSTLDLAKVNVVFETSSAATVPQSQDCSNPNGWKYVPDAAKPNGIELCEGQCGAVKGSSGGKLKLVVGCATKDAQTR